MLARREHSQRELTQKLTGKGFKKEDIEQLLQEFAEKNWQSDIRFAESYSRSRLQKGFGPIRIQLELRERGVDINLDTLFDEPPDWANLLTQLATKKYGGQPPTDIKERAKRMRFLQHKGFSGELIKHLFDNIS